MEEKYNIAMDHHAHEHLLILNETYIAKKGNVCSGCLEQVDSCTSVYSCSNITSTSGVKSLCVKFLLHKTCAEVPLMIEDPLKQEEFLVFHPVPRVFEDGTFFNTPSRYCTCKLCFRVWYGFSYASSSNSSYVCFKCAVFIFQQSKEDALFEHPGHKHPLALIEHPSSFKCYACKVNDDTLGSSYRCIKCQFWIHKSCGDTPPSFPFVIHKHPLIFSSSLPPEYQRFVQHCRLCNKTLNVLDWLYYCRSCRYFTHFGCAVLNPVLSFDGIETYPDLVHLPAANESSLNLLLEKFMEDKTSIIQNIYNNIYNIFSPIKNITHWAHEEHDLKLITIDELYERRHDNEMPLLCEGCVKPIRTDEGQSYYGCFTCKFFMHKVCAELPREIEHHLWPGKKLFADKHSEPFKLFRCDGCGVLCNGIFYGDKRRISLHLGCVTLPKFIKHEAHSHKLEHFLESALGPRQTKCDACHDCFSISRIKYRCKKCRFCICAGSIMNVRTYKHRWDPHPLDLIYDAGMVTDHEHDYDCEYCSVEINTNRWFYHCSKCDLSFHLGCVEDSSYRKYKYVKFGASVIRYESHPHRLTYVLNKKVRSCEKCGEGTHGLPVLQCAAPCNVVFCPWCCK